MNTTEKVIEILRELSGCEHVHPDDSLQLTLKLDSLEMVKLLIELEDAFHIELEESDMNPFDLNTVSDVVELTSKYVGGSDEK